MNLEPAAPSLLSPPPLPGAVKGTLNAAERFDVLFVGVGCLTVALMGAMLASAAGLLPDEAVTLTTAAAASVPTALRAIQRRRQGEPPTMSYLFTSPDDPAVTVNVSDYDYPYLAAFAADPDNSGGTWTGDLWDWVNRKLTWISKHIGYIGPAPNPVIIPAAPEPLPTRPDDA